MKIISLKASNVMRLVSVEIHPQGHCVTLSGKNKSGKTSTLLAIASVLSGKGARPEKLLREGTDKGEIVIEIGNTDPELIAKLKVTPDGEVLTVTTAQGAKYSSPQQILDGLKGAIGFEPMTFLRLKATEQAAMLQKLVGLNFTEIDQKRQEYFDERTAVNREAKQARNVWDTAQSYSDAPEKEVSIVEATEKLREANAKNAENAAFHKAVDNLAAKGKNLSEEIIGHKEELDAMLKAIEVKRARIAEKETELTTLRARYAADAKALKDLKDIDTQPLQWDIEQAETTNRKVRANLQKRTWEAELNAKETEADRLTKEIEAIDKDKEIQLAEAKMPVKGLGFSANGITLNGIALEQSSGAEQLIVALGIGARLNSKLRVLLFKDCSLLDPDSLKIVEDFCNEHDLQCWMEVISSDDPGAILIQDGSANNN